MGITNRGRRLTIATLVASVTALLFTTLSASPAHAVPGPEGVVDLHTARLSTTLGAIGGTTGGTSGTNAPAGPYSNAPTANLFSVASHLKLRQKSVSTVVFVTAGLVITNNVEISILFGTQRVTQNYNPRVINRLAVELDPLDGAKRRERVTVTLREDAPTGPITYVVPWVIDVEPLFDLTISPLHFFTLDSCDPGEPLNPPDPVIIWEDAEGGGHIVERDGNLVTITAGFAGTWREIGQSSGLTAPDPHWYEKDLPIDFGAPPVAGPPVLPGTSHHFRKVDDGGDCNGQFDYDLTMTLRHYTLL